MLKCLSRERKGEEVEGGRLSSGINISIKIGSSVALVSTRERGDDVPSFPPPPT